MIDKECDNDTQENIYETFSRDENEILEPTSPLHSERTSRQQNQTNLENLLLEPLPPALGSDYLEALPLVSRHLTQGEDNGGGNHQFRFHGFGKYRQLNGKKRVQDSDEDTDGQWDEDVDADGYGSNNMQNGKKKKCKHRTIKNYQCENCPFKMTKFGTFFDSGQINRYLRILAMSDSEDCAASLGRDMDLIFECYNPTNIIQIRDHVLTVVGRSIISQVKKRNMGEHAYRVLPTEALYRDTIQYGKTYKQYLIDFKEQKRNVMKSKALFIDSQFESGNIEKVFKSKMGQEYHLFMNVDTNTRGHQQWFYFRIRNIKKGIPYKFTIWNFTKPKSLYRDGMRLMWMSRRKAKLLGIENDEEAWECIPKENIEEKMRYSRSPFTRSKERKGMFDRLFDEDTKDQKKNQPQNDLNTTLGYVKKFGEQSYYSLSFSLSFDYNNDTVFIAYSRPYKYSQIILDILKNEHSLMEYDPEKYPQSKKEEPARFDGSAEISLNNQFIYTRKLMCLSLVGLPVPILTVTATKNVGKKYSKREAVFITSRVHPGETNASFVFQGVLEMITKPNDPVAQYLREQYIFKLVPCLNPDGVVRGNYRSSFAGVDLNRQWICPNEFYHPTIFHTKNELAKLYKERTILMYCDLHGHSRKKNSFIYGCNRAANGGFNSWTKVRLLPRILAKLNHVFDIISCKFKVEKGKLGTGRVVIWKEFEVTNSFTLENSFHGFDYGNVFKEFQVEDLKKLGSDMILSLHQYQKILVEIQKELNITRGWLKPKRLLEVTGPTAQETLRIEQKKMAKKTRTEALPEDLEQISQFQSNIKKDKKLPRGPIIKTRAGPKVTLQGLIDQYVEKEQKQAEKVNQSIQNAIDKTDNAIDGKEAQNNQSGEKSKEVLNTEKDMGNTNSGDISSNSQKKSSKITNTLVISTKSITFKSSLIQNQNNQTKVEESQTSTAFSAQTNEKSGTILKSTQDDSITQESKDGNKKEGQFVIQSIIKIQSYIRMVLQKVKYIEMQANLEEEILVGEGQSNLRLPISNMSIEKASVINSEAAQLNVDLAFQQLTKQNDSDGVRIVSDEGLSDQQSNVYSPTTHVVISRLQTKYVNQLTLEMIESEGVVKLKEIGKPNTANHTTSRPQHKNSFNQINQDIEERKRREDEENVSPVCDKLDQIDDDTNEGDQEDNNENDVNDTGNQSGVDWRQFFTMQELTNAFDKIQQGEEDPNDQYEKDQKPDNDSVEDGGSDSCPSEDNIDLKQLYSAIYCEKNKANQAVEDLENIEEDYEKNFANFVKEVTKKYRDASKDSKISDGDNVQMHTEKRAEERYQVDKKKSDLILVNKGIDLSDKKAANDPSTKPKKLKLVLPGKKKKIREVSNDSNDTNGQKLKIKTNRKEKIFIINNTKKDDLKHSTIIPRRNANETITKGNSIKDKRLRSQEDIEKEKPKLKINTAMTAGNQTPSQKPITSLKHISRVTGINRSQVNKSFLPILNKATAAAAAANPSDCNLDQSVNIEGQKREDGDELRISESGKSPSMIESNTQHGMVSGMGTINPPNIHSSKDMGNATHYTGFGVDIIQEESMDRSTPLGNYDPRNNERYNNRMAATQKPGGFMTDQKICPAQNVNGGILRHPTQQLIVQSRGRVNDRYGNVSTNNSQISNQIQNIIVSPTNVPGSGIASFNQPHSLHSRNYSSSYQPQVQPQVRKLTALEIMEQELLRKNQQFKIQKPAEASSEYPMSSNLSNMGNGLMQAIQSSQNNGGWQQTKQQLNQTLRMPMHAIQGHGMVRSDIAPQKTLSQSPEQKHQRIKMGMPQTRQFGASMVASGISGLAMDQQSQQRTGPQQRQPIIYSPNQIKSLERPNNSYVLSKNNQGQSQLSNGLQLKLQQQQQLNQNLQLGLLRTPRRLVHQGGNVANPQTSVYPVSPGESNYSTKQQPFVVQSQERPYRGGDLQNHNLISPARTNIGEMQRLHFQKYQQFKRN